MRSMEKRQYEIEQGLRDPSELLGGSKDKQPEDDDAEESEAAKAAAAENATKAAMSAAAKGMKSSDPLERAKAHALMTAAKLGLAVPRPEPGDQTSAKPKTPQEALKEAMAIAAKYAHPGGEVWPCSMACVFARASRAGGDEMTLLLPGFLLPLVVPHVVYVIPDILSQ